MSRTDVKMALAVVLLAVIVVTIVLLLYASGHTRYHDGRGENPVNKKLLREDQERGKES